MKYSSLKKIFLFLFLIATKISFGQKIVLSQQTRASIITCGTGNESYSLFGHTAVRITDLPNNLDVVYNYGAFDFNTENFVGKFAKGDLQYFAVATNFSDFINEYEFYKRSVFEQELAISLMNKQKLFDSLNAVLTSDKNYYTYKFIDQNCTTMVVDILNTTLGTDIKKDKLDATKTYRTILFPYFDSFFYEKLGTSIIFGNKVDTDSDHIFLPFELYKTLQQSKFNNQLLCKQSLTLLNFKKQQPTSWWNNVYSFVGFLGIILILNKNKLDLIYITLNGILGIFFVIIGVLSLHQELKYNYNILLFNPIFLVLCYFILTKNKKWITILVILNSILLAIYVAIIITKVHFWIVLPIVVTGCIVLRRLYKKSNNTVENY